ncbi:MAG: hypothetical protein QI199_03775 [Candidatus Korarchaeota archaeon]|nr:hypothetical protein [Candidatus Korarchaeota archaeon]
MAEIPSEPSLFRTECGFILVAGLLPTGKLPLSALPGRIALVPVELVASLRHIVMAAFRACRALNTGKNVAEAFAYELGACLMGVREVSRIRQALSSSGPKVFVSICEDVGDCLRPLMTMLAWGSRLIDVEPRYRPDDLPSCSGNVEALAMEEGAMLELDR